MDLSKERIRGRGRGGVHKAFQCIEQAIEINQLDLCL